MKTARDIPFVEIPQEVQQDPGVPTFIAEIAGRYGPLLRTSYLSTQEHPEVLLLVGPEANRLAFHTHRECFSHDQGWSPLLGEEFGHGLLNMDPPEHTFHRRLMNPAFTSAYLAAYLPVMQRIIDLRTQDWQQRGEVDLVEESRQVAFDVAAATLASYEVGERTERLRQLFYFFIHGFDREHETWEEFEQRRHRAVAELDDLLLELIRARRSTLPTSLEDVLGMIVHAGAETGTRLTDEQILAHTKILLVAGHETTTHLGAWTLYLLATHSEYRQRVEEELAHEVGDGLLTYEHVRGLPILTNAIKEAGRLYSPVHAVPRGVIKPFALGEYEVPIGERVYIAIGATHRLPDVFADPGQFDPDRFAPPRDEERRTPYGLVTFGGGQRVCIGINFAQIEVKAFVAHVLRRFDLLPVPGGSPLQWNGITAFIPGGIHVRVAARRYDDSTTSSRQPNPKE